MEKLGIQNMKRLVDFFIALLQFVGISFVSKRFIFSLGASWTLISTLRSIFFGDTKINFAQVWPEMKDFTTEESKELVDYIKVKLSFDPEHQDIERTAETVVEHAGQLYKTIGGIVKFWSKKFEKKVA